MSEFHPSLANDVSLDEPEFVMPIFLAASAAFEMKYKVDA
jgi:hypothetical protein